MKKHSHKKKRRYKFFKRAPVLLSSVLDNIITRKEYSDEWSVIYEDNMMKINKGDNITWPEVLEIVKNQIVYFEERKKEYGN